MKEEAHRKALLEIVQEQQDLITYLLQDDRPELKEANQRIILKVDKLRRSWKSRGIL